MELQERKRPRMWMKFGDNSLFSRQDDASPGTMIRHAETRIGFRPPPPEPTRRKKPGATGFGFRLNVTVCPKLDQISLAFSAILLFLSLDLVVLTMLKAIPGLLSSKFTATQCKVVEKYYQNYTHCHVTTLNYHLGEKRLFPCLQVKVRVVGDNTTASLSSSVTSQSDPDVLLLYQNELQIAGEDYKRQPCSFLPDYCSSDAAVIANEVCHYSEDIGPVNSTVNCYYWANPTGLAVSTNGIAMRSRVVTTAHVVNSIIWPIVGVVASVCCCMAFWKKNHHRSRKLFIYNAWSPS